MPRLDARVLDVQVMRRPERLAAVEHARALLSGSAAPVDSIARLAAAAAATPIALVTLVGAERMYVLGHHGAPNAATAAPDLPFGASFCRYVVSGDRPVAIDDGRADPEVSAYWSGRQLAYLGCPVHAPTGQAIGAVCVVDTIQRRWTDADIAAISEAARILDSMLRAEDTARHAIDRHLAPRRGPGRAAAGAVRAAGASAADDRVTERRFLDAVLDSLDVGVAACDRDGALLLANHPHDHPEGAFELPLKRALAGEHLREAEIMITVPGGGPRTFLVNGGPIAGPDDNLLGAVVALHDVTGRRQAERLTESEVAVSRALTVATSVEAAGHLVLEAVGRIQGWRHAELWLAHEVGSGLRPVATWTAPGYDLRNFVPRSIAARQGLAGAAWDSGEPIWFTDGEPAGLLDAAAMAGHELNLAVAVPVRSPRRALGVLTFFAEAPRARDEALLAALSGVAAHIGQYVERRRAEELTSELARAKDEFIALVGHELRTPLTSVSAYTDLLLSDDAVEPEERREFLGIIHRNAETLRAIIDDLLDLAGLESGYVTIRAEHVDLTTIVRDSVAAIRPTADEKGVALGVHLEVETAPMTGDAARLRQVIDNLVTNAVTYTMAGGNVDVRLVDDEAAYTVTVADTGIGIPPAERQKLFQRFFRASNTRSRGIPGTGLGLTISRTIVERHAGTITVHDDAGPGTTFEVRLPSAP